jgi:hypothetical protein
MLSNINGGGTLPAGNYFVRTTWTNSSGETVPGPERSINTTLAGALVVQAPVNPPANATQWKIYISTTTGTETLQATQTTPFTNYSQSTPLAAGSAMPVNNTTACSLRFNDELQPSYTGYNVTFTTATGATIPGFPQKWYLSGGSAGTINVGSGLPLYSGTVVYPQPIITNPAQSATQSINGPINMNGFKLTDSNINGFLYVDGTTFTTIQQAITAACANGGGTVYVPPGTYPQNSSFALCAGLNLIGAARNTADNAACATTITTTLTNAELFPVTQDHVHISDMCLKNNGLGGAIALHLTGGRFGDYERLYISGPWNVGIQMNPNIGVSSAILNTFKQIHTTGLQANGIGCLLDSGASVNQVINGNVFNIVNCTGGTGGIGLKVTGGNSIVNENVFFGSQFTATTGTGVLLNASSSRDLILITPTIEGSTTGLSIAAGNLGFSVIGGEINANTGSNVVNNSTPSDRIYVTGNVGSNTQLYGVDQTGVVRSNGLCFDGSGTANCTGGNISGNFGMVIQGGSNAALTFNASSTILGQNLDMGGKNLLNGGGIITVPAATGNLAETNVAQNWSGNQTGIGLVTPTIGGGSTLNLYKTATDFPGNITVNAQSCSDRSVTIAGSINTAVIMPTANYALEAGLFLSPGQAVAGTAHYRICNVTAANITLNAASAFNLAIIQ